MSQGTPSVCATIVLPALTFLVCRGRPRPWGVVVAIDGGTLLGVTTLLAIASATAPAAIRTNHTSATIFALVVSLRAALVPSPPLWTALVSLVAVGPLAVQAYLASHRPAWREVG